MTDKMTPEQAISEIKYNECNMECRIDYEDCNNDICRFKVAIESLEKQKWHKYVKENPTKEGQYLCCKFNTNRPYFVVYWWSDDLYTVDEFDFLECKGKSGFYEYDSEWGYCEMDCSYWKPIDWESDTDGI